MIEYLRGMSSEAREMIDDARAKVLIEELHEFFAAHCDDQQNMNFLEMAFILSRGLSYVLQILTRPCDCEQCDHCHKKYDPEKETIH